MTYTKPEISTLGDPKKVIEMTHAKPYSNVLDSPFGENPAYDLDE